MSGRHASGTGPEPEGLRDAVLAYEAALMADDVASLDDWFEPGPGTLRGDANGLLVGHEAISAFRRARGGAAARTVSRLELRALGEGLGAAVLVVEPASGGHGMLTQVWRRTDGRWRIVAAQVAAPAPAIDGRVWRVVGTPLAAGAASGPLAGRGVAVKDLFAVAGFAIGAGNPTRLAEAPVETATAPAVQRLLEAGAHVTGIARTDEFAYAIAGVNAHYGAPPNGAVPGAIPGGSSSGPASAVALGQADIGLGTDTGGSIRVPASYQGLWGLRTTHGAVPREGVLPLAPGFDTVGWLTRDAAVLRDALVATLGAAPPGAGAVAAAPLGAPVVAPALLGLVEPAVAAAADAAIHELGGAGMVDLGDPGAPAEAFRVVQAAEAWAAHGAWLGAHPGAVTGAVAERFAIASRIDAGQERAARAALAEHRARLDGLLGDRVLLLPSASSAAPTLGADLEPVRAATMRLTCIAGVTGRPALSIPLLTAPGPSGPAPVGLCLVGPRGSDLALVELGDRIVRHLTEARMM